MGILLLAITMKLPSRFQQRIRCTLRDSSPTATRSNRHEPLAGWCTVVGTNAGVLGSVSALAYPPATRPAQWFAHGSRLLILLFFFQSLRASRGNELLHTLTLGQALMPAGLPVEERIMHHACGPRRAWLKIHLSLLHSPRFSSSFFYHICLVHIYTAGHQTRRRLRLVLRRLQISRLDPSRSIGMGGGECAYSLQRELGLAT